jgi:hypothetical protein
LASVVIAVMVCNPRSRAKALTKLTARPACQFQPIRFVARNEEEAVAR